MKRKFFSFFLVFVLSVTFINKPTRVEAQTYLADAMAQKFVDLFYSNSGDTASMVKDVLTGKEAGTFELMKEIIQKASTVVGYAEGLDILPYDEQVKLTTISNVINSVDSAISIIDNYKSMWQSTSALQATVDGIQISVGLANIWGVSLPPTIGAACAAVELTLAIGSGLQASILKEYQEIYQMDLLTAKYANTDLPSPIGYITVVNEFNYTQKEVDSILSGVYMQFLIEEVLSDLSSSGSGSTTPTTYTITFNSNCSDVSSFSKTYSISDSVGSVTMERAGYIFDGWYFDSACTNKVGSYYQENQTWYAKWIPRYTTITFDSNCDDVEDVVRTYDKLVEEWEEPVLECPGHIFQGWYWDSDCTNAVTSYSRTENHTFYAKWVVEFDFTVSNNEVTITGLACYRVVNNVTITDIVIPHTIEGFKVRRIGDAAFKDCKSLTNIAIPSSVTSIGDSAFSGCSSLANIDIPDSVTYIGDFAFAYCTSLTGIVVSDSITTIGNDVFRGCRSLTNIIIPDIVTSIGNSAFYDCRSLNSIAIPNSVTSIGDSAFMGCRSLANIIIPDNITSIEDRMFMQCISLKNITIPSSVTSIGEDAFGQCIGLTNIIISDSVTSIGNFAFEACTSLTNITLQNVTSIGDFAFAMCSGLTNLDIPDGVTSISDYMFYECSSLKSITIPDSVTTIGDSAFDNCISLTNITIPNNVTFIGEAAFLGCSSLTDIGVSPDNRNYISLDGVLFNKNATTLLFYPCNKPNALYSIPDGVTSIGEYAFRGCHGLTKISIPNSVTNIADGAFYGCDALTAVLYKGTQTRWNSIDIGSSNDALINAIKYYDCKYASDNMYITYNGVTTTAYITPEEKYIGKTIILALHKEGRLVDIKSDIFNGSKLEFSSMVEHDMIKLMIWENLLSMKAIDREEAVSTLDWIN